MNRLFKTVVLSVILFLGATFQWASAQTLEEATNTYNQGVALAATDLPGAITALQQAADIAKKIGDEGAEILNLSQQQMPALQYNYATSLYKEKKMDEAITNFELAYEYADKVGDDGIKAKTADLIPKLYRAKGNGEYKAEQYDAALTSFANALKYDPSYAGAYLSEGLVYNKQNNTELMKTAMDSAIATGNRTKDEKTVEQAVKFMSDNLMIEANNAFKKNNFNMAISLLDDATSYTQDNPELYYLYALSYNKLSKWDEAIDSAEKGLNAEEKTSAKQARFYFEMGMAQAGKGATDEACTSFKKAAVGPLAESANYQIKTVLKCN
ncbi:MAG: tetratricopeptide repeat protein [Lentimicrobium sp.]|jgi:tetratricopeptide (TPR) repeat protein|nr:tetratricopeptide repeat protein [Lentimicrobium sp.]